MYLLVSKSRDRTVQTLACLLDEHRVMRDARAKNHCIREDHFNSLLGSTKKKESSQLSPCSRQSQCSLKVCGPVKADVLLLSPHFVSVNKDRSSLENPRLGTLEDVIDARIKHVSAPALATGREHEDTEIVTPFPA